MLLLASLICLNWCTSAALAEDNPRLQAAVEPYDVINLPMTDVADMRVYEGKLGNELLYVEQEPDGKVQTKASLINGNVRVSATSKASQAKEMKTAG